VLTAGSILPISPVVAVDPATTSASPLLASLDSLPTPDCWSGTNTVVLCIKSLGHYSPLYTRRHHTVIVLLPISPIYLYASTPAFLRLFPIISSTLSIPSTPITDTQLFPADHLGSIRLLPACPPRHDQRVTERVTVPRRSSLWLLSPAQA
jgi:hypothetical protein